MIEEEIKTILLRVFHRNVKYLVLKYLPFSLGLGGSKNNSFESFVIKLTHSEVHEDVRLAVDLHASVHILEALGQQCSTTATLTHDENYFFVVIFER